MPFQMPTGLLNAATGAGQRIGLPTGLMQGFRQPQQFPNRDQFQQNAVQSFTENAGNVDLSGLSWQNPNDNPIEQLLNNDEPGSPYFKIKTTIQLDPETGQLVAVPLTDQFGELYRPGEQGGYYTGHEIGSGDEMGRFSVDDASQLPGYTQGETFRNDDAVYYYNPYSEWETVDNAGYTRPNMNKQPRYVDQYVMGRMPGSFYNQDVGPLTGIVADAINPTIDNYVAYLNQHLTPEQLAAAFDSGIDPLNMNYQMHDWDLVKSLIGGEGGMGRVPTKIMGDMTDWAGSIYDAAGLDFSPEPRTYLPTGLMNF